MRSPQRFADVDRSYTEFYSRFRRPLVCYVQTAFPDADVEGVAQDAFCRALNHWSEVGRMRDPWPWLAVTARNLARNNIRDARSLRWTGLDAAEEVSTWPDVAEQVHASDQLRRLAKAMEVLTPSQQQILTVLVVEGLKGKDVAQRLGLRPGSARMQLCRMRVRLAARFAELGGQLAVFPLAILRALWRPRHARAAHMTTAPAGLVWSAAAAAVAGAFVFGCAPATPAAGAGDAANATTAVGSESVRAAGVRPAVLAAALRRAAVHPTAQSAGRAPSHVVVASAGDVHTGRHLQTQGVAVERRGRPESPREVVDRCVQRLTVSPSHIGCDGPAQGPAGGVGTGSGTGTQ